MVVATKEKLKVALLGQSKFAAEVFARIVANGHEVLRIRTKNEKKV